VSKLKALISLIMLMAISIYAQMTITPVKVDGIDTGTGELLSRIAITVFFFAIVIFLTLGAIYYAVK